MDILSTAWVAKIRQQPSLKFASSCGRGPVQGQPPQLGGAIARGEEQGTQVGNRRVPNNSQGGAALVYACRVSSAVEGGHAFAGGSMSLR